MVAAGLVAIGSGPAGVSAAETFRARHRHIPVRILSSDPALPYAKPPLSKQFLCGLPAELDLHSEGWFERNAIDLVRGVTVERIDVEAQEVITSQVSKNVLASSIVAPVVCTAKMTTPSPNSSLSRRASSASATDTPTFSNPMSKAILAPSTWSILALSGSSTRFSPMASMTSS